MVNTTNTGKEQSKVMTDAPELLLGRIWEWLENVCDPEVPVLTVLDLGVVRRVAIQLEDELISSPVDATNTFESKKTAIQPTTAHLPIVIDITPTYTGCPAMNMIAANIRLELLAHGLENVTVVEVLSPAWTTDWMRDSAKKKLLEYGIAPPLAKARMDKMLFSDIPVPCPQCGSENTERISEFGSTACKSLHRCLDCREPFDYFKCH